MVAKYDPPNPSMSGTPTAEGGINTWLPSGPLTSVCWMSPAKVKLRLEVANQRISDSTPLPTVPCTAEFRPANWERVWR